MQIIVIKITEQINLDSFIKSFPQLLNEHFDNANFVVFLLLLAEGAF